jgi:hypothetical protein
MINSLKPNQVFVFGSNLEGYHGSGAAKQAVEQFGAEMGKGVGQQGQSYAIPTMGGELQMMRYIYDFLEYAVLRPNLEFLLTPIGTGIAGYTVEQVAPYFKSAPSNVILPKEFK